METDHDPARTLLLYWCSEGLEHVCDLTDMQHQDLLDCLRTGQENTNNVGRMLTYMTLRARSNPQRNYEIYAITVDDTITVDTMRDQFQTEPQAMVDLIRQRGQCLYSDRKQRGSVII